MTERRISNLEAERNGFESHLLRHSRCCWVPIDAGKSGTCGARSLKLDTLLHNDVP